MASRIWSMGGTLVAAILVAGGAYAFNKYRTFLNPPAVTTSTAFVAPLSEAVYGTGTVEPERWAKVLPLQRRRIVDLCRCEGQAVTARQVLAKQDDGEERSALQELEIKNDQLDRDLKRARGDRKRNEITKAELEQRETAFEESQSRIAAQRMRLDDLISAHHSMAWFCAATGSERSSDPRMFCSGWDRRCRSRWLPKYEPTGALDVASTEQVFGLLRDIADRRQTVVVVTHDSGLAARADRRIHIVDGRIAETTLGGRLAETAQQGGTSHSKAAAQGHGAGADGPAETQQTQLQPKAAESVVGPCAMMPDSACAPVQPSARSPQ